MGGVLLDVGRRRERLRDVNQTTILLRDRHHGRLPALLLLGLLMCFLT